MPIAEYTENSDLLVNLLRISSLVNVDDSIDSLALDQMLEELPAALLGSGTFAVSGTNEGIQIGNDITAGVGYLQSKNFVTGTTGWRIDSNGDVEFDSGTFRGTITATTGAIGGFDIGSDYLRDVANSMGLASTVTAGDDVRFWAGDTFANRATAPFRVTEAGVVVGSNITITGGSVVTSILNGLIGLGNLNVANRGWSQTSAFSVTDADTVAWGAGTFTTADGTAYSITGSNTGNMSAKTYIYLDTAVSTTAYQTTTTSTTAVGAGKVLVAIAENGTGEATFTVMFGQGGQNIDAVNIVAGSITANEIAASTITAGLMNVSQLSAIAADLGTITAGSITVVNGANTIGLTPLGSNVIFSGPTGAPTFTVTPTGDSVQSRSTILQEFTAGENITAGDLLSLGQVAETSFTNAVSITADTWVGSALPDATHDGVSELDIDTTAGVQTKYAFLEFATSFTGQLSQFNRVWLRIRLRSGTSLTLNIHRVTSDWNPATLTWNTMPTIADGVSDMVISVVTPSSAGYFDIDITPLFCLHDSGVVSNYGVRIGMPTNGNVILESSDAGGGSQPFLKMRGLTNVGSVYKAKNIYPLDYYAVLGFAYETITSGNTIKVNLSRVVGGLSGLTAGSAYYLSDTAGAITNSINGLGNSFYQIGRALSTTTLIFEKVPITIKRHRIRTASGTTSILGDMEPEHSTSGTLEGGNTYDVVCEGVPPREIRFDATGGVGVNGELTIAKGVTSIPASEESWYTRVQSASATTSDRDATRTLNLISDGITMTFEFADPSYFLFLWAGFGGSEKVLYGFELVT